MTNSERTVAGLRFDISNTRQVLEVDARKQMTLAVATMQSFVEQALVLGHARGVADARDAINDALVNALAPHRALLGLAAFERIVDAIKVPVRPFEG